MSGVSSLPSTAGHPRPRDPQVARPLRPGRRRAVVAAGVITAAIVIVVGLVHQAGALTATTEVPSVLATRGEFTRRVVAEGNLEAVDATPLGPPPTSRGGMRIAWLAVDGSRVKEGDVVIRFDPTDMEKKLRDGQGDRRAAESRIAQRTVREQAALRNLTRDADMAVMELDHTRLFATRDPDVFSRVEIIESEIDGQLATQRKDHADEQPGIRRQLSEIELALLDIQRGKADLQISEARTELQDLEGEAPHDGIFVLKEIWGNTPSVGSMVWGGNSVAELPRLDRMQAKVYVLEADAGGLEVGLPAVLTLDAHPGRSFDATIKNVDTLAMNRSPQTPVQYFGVVLELATSDLELMKPGQRVQATLTLARQADAIAVPRQAVFEKDGKSIVYVDRGSGFDPVEVTLGATGLGRVAIESGVEEGDRLALRDPNLPLFEREPAATDAVADPVQAAL